MKNEIVYKIIVPNNLEKTLDEFFDNLPDFNFLYKESLNEVVSIEKIVEICCQYWGISKNQLQQKSRKRELIHRRQILCYLCHTLTKKSDREIGMYAVNQDHATVLYSRRKIQELFYIKPIFDEVNLLTSLMIC